MNALARGVSKQLVLARTYQLETWQSVNHNHWFVYGRFFWGVTFFQVA